MKVGSLLASVVLLVSVACGDDPTTPNTNHGNMMTAVVDGLDVAPSSVTAVKSGNRIHIVGTGAFRTVTLSLEMPTSTGEVMLFREDGNNTALIAEGTPPNNPVWSTAFVPVEPEAPQYSLVNFVSVSSTGVSGTFNLKAGPASSNAIGVRYGNGTFSVKF